MGCNDIPENRLHRGTNEMEDGSLRHQWTEDPNEAKNCHGGNK